MRWLLRGLLAVVLVILLAWGALVYQYREAAGPDVPVWQLALFIADEVGARLYCAVTGCPAELPEGMTLREWAAQDLVPSTPVAIDVDPAKLERAQTYGARSVIDAKAGVKEVRAALRDVARKLGAPADGCRIFETSGTPKGQELAFSLLSHAGVLSIVGFTPEPVNARLSNLMALDATAHGNWGSDPAIYPEAVQLCLSGQVQVRPFVKESRLSDGIALLEAAHHHSGLERPILVP